MCTYTCVIIYIHRHKPMYMCSFMCVHVFACVLLCVCVCICACYYFFYMLQAGQNLAYSCEYIFLWQRLALLFRFLDEPSQITPFGIL